MAKKKEVDEVVLLKAQLTRALADYDNFRKRVEKEASEADTRALSKLVLRFLPILDMLEHIQKSLEDPGLAIAIKEFKDGLTKEGVTVIEPEIGDTFDENFHEVVEVVQQGLEDNEITEVVLPGWRIIDGMVIRPAKVKVNKLNN
jgi:molecular chaperone GrpE